MSIKQREVKFELLRILAMGMIITLHYLSKGGFLKPLTDRVTLTDGFAWFIEAFCLVAVNVYVLISGYFGCTSKWNIRKLFTLWLQVVSYALVVGVFVLFSGLIDRSVFNIYEGVKLICPVITEHYWFATSYFLLFVMMPFLKAGIEKLSQKEFGIIIVVLILLQSVMKSILPMHLPWDKLGYDAWWFVTLFLTGAYINKYEIAFLKNKVNCVAMYVVFSLMTFSVTMGLHYVYQATGSLSEFITYAYTYNHIFCLLASVGFFGIFMNVKEKEWKQEIAKKITLLSGATFGVYLLHEHIWVRYQWPLWLGAEHFQESPFFVLHLVVSVLAVYTVGTVVELLRQQLFRLITGRR